MAEMSAAAAAATTTAGVTSNTIKECTPLLPPAEESGGGGVGKKIDIAPTLLPPVAVAVSVLDENGGRVAKCQSSEDDCSNKNSQSPSTAVSVGCNGNTGEIENAVSESYNVKDCTSLLPPAEESWGVGGGGGGVEKNDIAPTLLAPVAVVSVVVDENGGKVAKCQSSVDDCSTNNSPSPSTAISVACKRMYHATANHPTIHIDTSEDDVDQDEDQSINNEDGSSSVSSSLLKTWHCSACTFHNADLLYLACAMCGTARRGVTKLLDVPSFHKNTMRSPPPLDSGSMTQQQLELQQSPSKTTFASSPETCAPSAAKTSTPSPKVSLVKESGYLCDDGTSIVCCSSLRSNKRIKISTKVKYSQIPKAQYPIGCPVWFNLQWSTTPRSNSKYVTANQGSIQSSSFDQETQTWLYEIKQESSSSGTMSSPESTTQIPEHDIAFAIHCPVLVRTEECFGNNEYSESEGQITNIMFVNGENKHIFLYTVLYTNSTAATGSLVKVEEGILPARIKYKFSLQELQSRIRKIMAPPYGTEIRAFGIRSNMHAEPMHDLSRS